MSKILKLNSYSRYDELGDRDYMVYEVEYDDGHKEYVSRDMFRNLKALEIIKDIWGDNILTDIEKGFVLGQPYIKLPDKEKCDLLKEMML